MADVYVRGGRGRSALAGVLALLVLAGALGPTFAEVLGGLPDDIASAPGMDGPWQGIAEQMDGLQYADPAAGIDLIEPPQPSNYGSAAVTHPVELPPGRLEWQPEISLDYSSDGANDWMGVGWSLAFESIDVPALGAPVAAESITVDTRWGVPRYNPNKESESYLFGGEQLTPHAHRQDLLDREAERIFQKRVEGDFLRIQRHGDHPADYWWEVHDKIGNKYYYGGRPGDASYAEGSQVDAAVKRDRNGNAYFWGIVEK